MTNRTSWSGCMWKDRQEKNNDAAIQVIKHTAYNSDGNGMDTTVYDVNNADSMMELATATTLRSVASNSTPSSSPIPADLDNEFQEWHIWFYKK